MRKILVILLLISLLLLLGCDDPEDGEELIEDNPGDDGIDDGSDVAKYLEIEGGNLQSGFVNSDLADSLAVRVINRHGSGAVGLQVNYTILAGEAEGSGTAILQENETVSGIAGIARCAVRFGSTPGMIRVKAELPDHSVRPVIFTLSSYPKPTAGKKPICFLSFNDFHSHVDPWGHPEDLRGGIARLAWALRTIRENNDRIGVATVVLDGGDDFENTIYHDIPGCLSWMIEVWDRAGVDIWQVGNHDFHFGLGFLTEVVEAARENFTPGAKGHPMHVTFGNVDPAGLREDLSYFAPLFETNFGDKSDERLYQQTVMLDVGGIKVGVLGAVTDAAIYTQVAGDPMFMKLAGAPNPYRQGLIFLDPDPREDDYINRGIDALAEQGADVVVVVSHTGLGLVDRVNLPPGKDHLIAKYGQGPKSGRAVDLIISAHSHVQLNRPALVTNPAGEQTTLVQAREGGLFIARVDGMADTSAGGFELIDSRLIQVDGNLESDPQVAEEADAWKEADPNFDRDWFEWDLVANPVWLSHRAGTPSGLGTLINDAFLAAVTNEGFSVDGAVAIPSLYRTDLWPGMISAPEAFEVVPLHKMDDDGMNSDTLAILTFRAGLMNASTLMLPGTWREETTALAYLLELIHSLPDLGEIIPPLSKELKIEVFQMAGVSYELDVTAPMYQHVATDSITIGGEPIDPNREYKVVMVHSLATTLSAALNRLLVGYVDGEGFVSPLIPDPETGLLFTDTEIPLWESLQDYLTAIPDGEISLEDVTVVGDVLRTVQPDVAINPSEMAFSEVVRGERAAAKVVVRNLGLNGIESARARLFFDATPWDQTDQDDGNSEIEGLASDYLGSLELLGSQNFELDSYPDSVELSFEWTMQHKLPPGLYAAHIKVDELIGEAIDPNTGLLYQDPYPDNDSGEQIMYYFEVK
jgi:2',3'-cyclic-nucleotide 2'-phosphodiesterase (5'-nucleotidase family)